MADSADAALARYHAFAERAVLAGEVWGLRSDAGWAISDSGLVAGGSVMPFWSEERGAASAARGPWADYAPEPIPIDRFVGRWLTNMADEGVLVGPDWAPDALSGYEVGADDIRHRILAELGLA